MSHRLTLCFFQPFAFSFVFEIQHTVEKVQVYEMRYKKKKKKKREKNLKQFLAVVHDLFVHVSFMLALHSGYNRKLAVHSFFPCKLTLSVA